MPRTRADEGAPGDAGDIVAQEPRLLRWLFQPRLMMLLAFMCYGLVAYSTLTDRGPFAFLLNWEIAIFGSTQPQPVMVFAAVVIFGVMPKFWRYLAYKAGMTRTLAAIDAFNRSAPAHRILPPVDVIQRRGRWWCGVGLGLVLISCGAGAVSYYQAARPGPIEPLPVLTVSSAALAMPKATQWVEIRGGVPLTDDIFVHPYTIRLHFYKDYYTPIVPPYWRKGDKIYLVEKDEGGGDYKDAWNKPDPQGPIRGSLRQGGPAPWIQRSFQRAGLQIGPWTDVLDRSDIGATIPPSSDDTGLVASIVTSLAGSVSLLLGFSLLVSARRRRAATSVSP